MKGKILIIEDNHSWQIMLKKYLQEDGFYVEVTNDLATALLKIEKEMFHFVTIDMQLDNNNKTPGKYEGWTILETVKKIRLQNTTPCMVITAWGEDYEEVKKLKNVESLFIMEKQTFDRKIFLEIINKNVERIDLRFKDDHRGY